jgi:hypothetical protein
MPKRSRTKKALESRRPATVDLNIAAFKATAVPDIAV